MRDADAAGSIATTVVSFFLSSNAKINTCDDADDDKERDRAVFRERAENKLFKISAKLTVKVRVAYQVAHVKEKLSLLLVCLT